MATTNRILWAQEITASNPLGSSNPLEEVPIISDGPWTDKHLEHVMLITACRFHNFRTSIIDGAPDFIGALNT